MAEVLPLDHLRLRLDGDTLVCRGLRHRLAPRSLYGFADALNDARVRRCTVAVDGFVLDSDGEELVVIHGWDMGPMVLDLDEATTLCLACAVAFAELPRDEQEQARAEALVRKVRALRRAPVQLSLLPGGGAA